MPKKKRDTGIQVLGSVPWGARIWVFYDTRRDLVDTMSAFFGAGLQNNEFCSMITSSNSDKAEAIKELDEALPELSRYMEKGGIEFVTYDEIHLRIDSVGMSVAYADLVKKISKAKESGLDGVRSIVDLSSLIKGDLRIFTNKGLEFDKLIGDAHYLSLCMYPLDKCQADEFVYVLKNHRYVLVNRHGMYSIGNYAGFKRTWNTHRYGQNAYHSVIQNLREALKSGEDKFLEDIRSREDVVALTTLEEGKFLEVSKTFTTIFGYSRDEAVGRTAAELSLWAEAGAREGIVNKLKERESILNGKTKVRIKTGEIISLSFSNTLIDVDGVPCILWLITEPMKQYRAKENRRGVERIGVEEELTRLQKKYVEAGLKHFSELEIIELLLEMTLPWALVHHLADKIIKEFHTLHEFLEAPVDRWRKLGIPQQAALSLLLIQEVPELVLKRTVLELPRYKSPQQVVDYMYYTLRNAKKEILKVIHLNNGNQIEEIEDLFEGDSDRISFNLREAIEKAISRQTKALIFIHNHPAGDPTPSKTYKQITRDLVFIGYILHIPVFDHIIIGDKRYFSFAEEGLIDEYRMDFMNLRLRGTSEARHRLEKAGIPIF